MTDNKSPEPQNHLERPALVRQSASLMPDKVQSGSDVESKTNPSTRLEGLNVDSIARRIALAASELDENTDPNDEDAIVITHRDLEAVAHRHITIALERAALAASPQPVDGEPVNYGENGDKSE